MFAGHRGWRERPRLLVLGIFPMLAMPTFDLFRPSYHRLAGMLLLRGLTSPSAPSHDAGG